MNSHENDKFIAEITEAHDIGHSTKVLRLWIELPRRLNLNGRATFNASKLPAFEENVIYVYGQVSHMLAAAIDDLPPHIGKPFKGITDRKGKRQ